MFTKPNWFILVSTVAAAVCLALLLADPDDGTAGVTDLDEAARDRLASEAAMRQIARESKAVAARVAGNPVAEDDPVVVASAPPGFQPAQIVEREPSPPEGYSFSTYHEAVRTPLTETDRDGLHRESPTPEWMGRDVAALADQAAAQGRDWTFGWVKLAPGAGHGDLAGLLAAEGGAVIGRAGDLVRVRLPADRGRLESIAASGAVAAIGTVPPADKITETLAGRALAEASAEAPVWITLMDDDPGGAWRRGLEGLGAVVGRFDPAVRAYAATVPLAALESISRADYVLAVESIGRVVPALAVATSVMGADAVRSHDAAAGLFSGVGGASVPIGVMDTGLNVDHVDIGSNRRSICGANFIGVNERAEDRDLWIDSLIVPEGHGTGVTGTVVGSGTTTPLRAGMAPLVQDIRIAKAVGLHASALGWARALDWLAKPSACGDDVPRKPLVVNSSLGISHDIWTSRANTERKIDATVWSARQLFVTSMGNIGPADPLTYYSSMAGAKNALTVGATHHSGDIADFSSRGPTDDGRLNPKVVGPGVEIEIPKGAGNRTEYVIGSGTSFASPAVAGVAALVMDAIPDLREEPAALRARLMASAVKPDAFLGAATFPLDNTRGPGSLQNAYGLGKVSARTAVLNRDAEDGWTGGSTAFDVDPDGYLSHEIAVPEGAGRLDVVLTWDEPPADTIIQPVLHDLDLWVDWQGSCGAIPACGRFHSLSSVDNVEWVVVPNPPPGVYRLKVTPNRVVGAPPRAGLAWTVIRGASTPRLGVEANVERIDVEPGEPFEVEATLTADGYVAAGARLRVDCRAAVGSDACAGLVYRDEEGDESFVRREDAVDRPLGSAVFEIDVGEIGPGERRAVTLRFPGRPAAGSFQLYLAASAWNANSGATSVAVVVGDPDAESPEPVRRPPNDDYDSPAVLAGGGGETTFDLVAATPDPGIRSAHRSLWYLWTAPDHGLVRFTIPQSGPFDYSEFVVVAASPDGPVAGLEAIGGQLGGGAVFHAERGETYRILLLIEPEFLTPPESASMPAAPTPALTMTWGPVGTPGNDRFAHAAAIEGGTGSLVGNNQGATTEPGELIGYASAFQPADFDDWSKSVWHRWVAPASGDWRFAVNRQLLAVAVFAGDAVADARLVSGAPGTKSPDEAVFPATGGEEYRIAVASKSAYLSGTEFTLSWEPGARAGPANDDFAAARRVAGGAVWTSANFNAQTVQHGEPAGSGVRTAWYVWDQSAAGGRHTWLVEADRSFLGDAPLRMSVFKGSELAALETVATNAGNTADLRLAFDTEAGEPYAFALGLPRDAALARISRQQQADVVGLGGGRVLSDMGMQLLWGRTPENDDLADAVALTGMSGSVAGSNEFATVERGELTGALGDSSLWWTFETTESKNMRFVLDGQQGTRLAIYRTGDDGSLDLLATSNEWNLVEFEAEAGVRYTIRVGSSEIRIGSFAKGGEPGSFELSWGIAPPRARLRFVEVIPDQQTRPDLAEIQFGRLGAQAFNAEGTELYVASESGLVVFERDPDTGELTLARTLTGHPLEHRVQLLWDGPGSALLVASCNGWTRFTPAAGGSIEYAGTVDGGPCPRETLLMHGSFVHSVEPSFMIETFRFDEQRTALTSVDQVMVDGVAKAAMTADGSHVYAVTAGTFSYPLLMAFERDAETGSLGLVSTLDLTLTAEDDDFPFDVLPGERRNEIRGLAVGMSHLFLSTGLAGLDTAVFDLADPGNPAFVDKLDEIHDGVLAQGTNCAYSAARHDVAAVDIACDESPLVYTVQVDDGTLVYPADLLTLSPAESDYFGNSLPYQHHVRSLITSPDGRHVYIAGAYEFFHLVEGNLVRGMGEQMVVFERRLGD